MAKCKDCGLLAVWLRLQNRFDEATDRTRTTGLPPETIQNDREVYQAKCFIQKYPLPAECEQTNPLEVVFSYNKRVLEVINKERQCNGYTDWHQGFSPKEHQEMLDKKSERRWRFVDGIIFAIGGGAVALFSQWVVTPASPVINISPPAVNITTPPVNVTVQVPEVKRPIAEQSIPPKTTHGQKHQQP